LVYATKVNKRESTGEPEPEQPRGTTERGEAVRYMCRSVTPPIGIVRGFLERECRRPFTEQGVREAVRKVTEDIRVVLDTYRRGVEDWSPELVLALKATEFRGRRFTRPELRRALNEVNNTGSGTFAATVPERPDA
jgi:hypothetical protein